MSFNQSKSDKNESQYRKPGGGRSGQQRTFTGGRGRGGGGSTAPPVSVSSAQSSKKIHNGQGVQSRVVAGSVNAAAASGAPAQNGSHSQHTHADAPAATYKPNDMATQRKTAPIPRAPSSQSPALTSDSSTTPKTPAKGVEAKGFSLQFGSISPGCMNGMQVPARTTSAPPNIDELKRDQAQHAALKGKEVPIPQDPLPRKQVPRKEVPNSQHIAGEPNAPLQVKREAPVSSAPPASQAKKTPAIPMPALPMKVQYPQQSIPQQSIPMQFGGPNPQMQSQGMPASSLPMPMQMPLQMANPSQVQQQMFMPGLQHPMMQPQALMHQSQNLAYTTQMSQLSHQLGSPGMKIAPQYSPQQAVNYSSARKAVKITHPDTREELRLDKKMDMHSDVSTPPRTHHNVPAQQYSPGQPMGYYPPNAYAAGPQYFPAPSSAHPITSAQLNPIPQQASRFNYPASQASHTVPFLSRSPPNSMPANKGVTISSSNLDSSRVTQNVVLSSPVVVTIKPAASSSTEKIMDSKPVEKGETPRISRPDAETSSLQIQKDCQTNVADKKLAPSKSGSEEMRPLSVTADENVANETVSSISSVSHAKSSNTSSTDGRAKETAVRPESIMENQKKPVNKGNDQSVPQLGVQTHLEQSSATRAAPIDKSSYVDNFDLESPAGNASEVVGDDRAVVTGVAHSTDQQDPLQPKSSGTGKPAKENLDEEKQKCDTLVDALKQEVVEKGNIDCELDGNKNQTNLVDTSITSSYALGGKIDRETSTAAINASDNMSGREAVTEVQPAGHEGDTIVVPVKASEGNSEKDSTETARPTSSSGSVSITNKVSVDSNKTRTASIRGKKNLKQILQKADAQGTTSDLYMAYKGPDEKIERGSSVESSENSSNYEMKIASGELDQDVSSKEKEDHSKAEPDDWEDAADVSTPKLQTMSKRPELAPDGEEAGTAKKYTRDFLLTFSELYTSLPEGLERNNDITELLSRPNSGSSRGENQSSGRNMDRPSSGHKNDRRGGGTMEADRWNKHSGSFQSPRETGQDSGYGNAQMGLRSGQGGNQGILRNSRVQPSAQYPILSGPMHSMQRNVPDADRWRNVNFKGLMPPPPSNMHKAERKYQIGKVTDEEQAKQRKLKGILNKLTPQNFDKLFAQVKEVNIDNVITLTGVISQIFDKALTEPTFCEMYSNFCHQLSLALPELSVDDEKVTFKRLLLNKCQEEFERGEREEEEASKDDSGEEIKLSDGQREEKRVMARRRMLGNIRLIGELYKKSMLTERIMHECIRKLLGQFPDCVEEDIESLCKLMSTIGEMIDHPKGKGFMESYFGMLESLSNDMKLSSRVRFMLKDVIDLRKNRWQVRRKVEGPKKIEDVHRDAAQEKHAQSSRLNRGPSMGSQTRRGHPGDFGPRGGSGMLSSPVSQSGSFRGLPQGRNYAMQDVRTDDRSSFNSRNTPLPQRPLGDGPITLGPQGGLARGMSVRGQPSVSIASAADNSLSHGDTRRPGGLNGFSSREDSMHRFTPAEKLVVPQSNMQDHAPSPSRSIPASTPSRGQGIFTSQNTSMDNVLPEERLREKSIATIREYYSAKDAKEVDTCVRELNAPTFYPSVISIWVADSFDRRDPERELLNKLIVNLSKTRTGQLFMPDQLIKGFEAVLTNLEDTVSDAPKAPEYLGRLLSMLIVENIVSLRDIGGILYEGGEEPGCLREAGLAGDVLGSILENIKSEKGESAVKEVCVKSELRLEDFRPKDPHQKSKKLELFI